MSKRTIFLLKKSTFVLSLSLLISCGPDVKEPGSVYRVSKKRQVLRYPEGTVVIGPGDIVRFEEFSSDK